jgi:hypothetical protein
MPLAGKSTNATFRTAYYNPGQANNFTVSVFDTQGNKTSVERSITPASGGNRAPQPFVTISAANAFVGQAVTLSASSSTDPGGSLSTATVEWDVDGDGVFDTAPSTTMTLSYRFSSAGNILVRARLRDSAGAETVSTPVPIGIAAPLLGISSAGDEVRLSWPTAANGFSLQSASAASPALWTPSTLPVSILNDRYIATITNPPGASLFRLVR